MNHTGGDWDPNERHLYFFAADVKTLIYSVGIHDSVLIAVNSISTAEQSTDLDVIEKWCDDGIKVFIDSGVYNLSLKYSQENGINFYSALAMDPEKMTGFPDLFDKYCKIMDAVGDKVWGYIEVDQGGVVGKRRLRAKLEGLGYRPIPVYHPLTDGWDYFDELATQYDRICVGNVVNSPAPLRMRICASIWERQKKYPDLWVHILGMTPSSLSIAYPSSSGDSSAWLRAVRWPAMEQTHTALVPISDLSVEYKYVTNTGGLDAYGLSAPRGIAVRFASYTHTFLAQNWQAIITEYNKHGLEP